MMSSCVSARADVPETLGPLRVGVVPAVAGGWRATVDVGHGGSRGHEALRGARGNGCSGTPPVRGGTAPARRDDHGSWERPDRVMPGTDDGRAAPGNHAAARPA